MKIWLIFIKMSENKKIMKQTINFKLSEYNEPDFNRKPYTSYSTVKTKQVIKKGIAPEGYHATSIFPEYIKIDNNRWELLPESRMDCTIVIDNKALEVKEARRLEVGDKVVIGRSEDGSEGIYVHSSCFQKREALEDKFAFRTRPTRETPFSVDYDGLYELLRYERENGNILWVLGPAVAFDFDARYSMTKLIEEGYVHALLAGNALATHDIEASLHKTGLGQDIYTKKHHHNGHYNHLDVLNRAREAGSIEELVNQGILKDGIIYSCIKRNIPFVLAGSIRDDGPLPEVIANVYEAQDMMRRYIREATTVIALATQLHSIATGNITPAYRIRNGKIRPVYFYIVDISEFAVDKLANRGSLEVKPIVTNVQDFLVTLRKAVVDKVPIPDHPDAE